MKLDTPSITAADTAVVLRIKLGPIRSWPDFLTDSIRGKQHLYGMTLIPCSQKKARGHYRPMYALRDIDWFIEQVLSRDPSAGKSAIKPVTLAIEPSKHWKLNRFNEDGSPTIH